MSSKYKVNNTKKSNNPKYSRMPKVKRSTELTVIKSSLSPYGCNYCEDYTFSCGHIVPIYEVSSVHALNQIIGYAKFINKSFGDVYYRGECKLHDSLLPSLFRGRSNISAAAASLNGLIRKIINDDRMKKQLNLDISDENSCKLKVEGLLQHYGIKTRFVDVVDNHWVALWMGLNRIQSYKQIQNYYHYKEREIPLIDFIESAKCNETDLFQYILLIAVPGKSQRINNGIFVSDKFYEIDLRQALPSTYIRPHAQHGLVVRKHTQGGESLEDYDLASNVVGIIKIRIDRVKQWIGTGELLTQNNLFPPPAYDNGYDILLSRNDLFDDDFNIARYI